MRFFHHKKKEKEKKKIQHLGSHRSFKSKKQNNVEEKNQDADSKETEHCQKEEETSVRPSSPSTKEEVVDDDSRNQQLEYLLEGLKCGKINPNELDKNGGSFLMHAVWPKHATGSPASTTQMEVVQLLVRLGANIFQMDDAGNTVAHLLCERSQVTLLEWFFQETQLWRSFLKASNESSPLDRCPTPELRASIEQMVLQIEAEMEGVTERAKKKKKMMQKNKRKMVKKKSKKNKKMQNTRGRSRIRRDRVQSPTSAKRKAQNRSKSPSKQTRKKARKIYSQKVYSTKSGKAAALARFRKEQELAEALQFARRNIYGGLPTDALQDGSGFFQGGKPRGSVRIRVHHH
eukprot:g4355.t1